MSIYDRIMANPGPTAPVEADDSAFSRGLRSGATALGGQLRALAGGVGETLGADEFAAEQYAASRAAQEQAAAEAPAITQWKDVHGLRDFGTYAGGLAGSAIPALGAGIAAGALTRNPRAALAAGTAAMAPQEIGDVIQRQQEDPTIAAQPAGLRLARAAASGLGSAALQNIVPAAVGGKLAGHTAEAAAAKTGAEILRGAATEVPVMAGAGVGGEALKQKGANPDKALDTDALEEAGIGGLVGGVPLVGAGAAGEFAHSRVRGAAGALKDAAGNAAQSAKDKLAGARGALEEKTQDVRDGLTALGKGKDDSLERMADGIPLGDLNEIASADGEKLQGLNAASIKAGAEKAMKWGEELLKDKTLSPEDRQRVAEALGNLGEQASQTVIAGIKKAKDVAGQVGEKIDRLYTTLRKSDDRNADVVGEAKEVPDRPLTMKSEDMSGLRAAIGNAIAPHIEELGPHLLADKSRMGKLADILAHTVQRMSGGQRVHSDDLAALLDIVGDKTIPILDSVQKAIDGTGDKKKTEAFFKQRNELAEVQAGRKKVTDLMAKHLRPELQNSSTPAELRQEAAMLDKWAAGHGKDRYGNEQLKAKDAEVHAALQFRYGDKADTILKAVEMARKKEERGLAKQRTAEDDAGETHVKDEGDGLTETDVPQDMRTRIYGGGRGGKSMMLHPDHDPGKAGFEGAAAQKLKKAQSENPHSTARFLSVDELGHDHKAVREQKAQLVKEGMLRDLSEEEAHRYAEEEIGKYVMVGVDTAKHFTEIAPDQLEAMKLDTHSHGKSDSRIDTVGAGKDGNVALDAMRIVRVMREHLKGQHDATTPEDQRFALKRTFMEGIAAVQDHLGKSFEIPDSTVVDRVGPGKRAVTWGELKKLDPRDDADRKYDAQTQELVRQRENYKLAGPTERANLRQMAEETIAKREEAKAKDLTRGEDNEPRDKVAEVAAARERRMAEIEEQLKTIDDKKAPGDRRALMNEWVELDKQREDASEHGTRKGTTDVKTEKDPFGNVHEALGGRDDPSAQIRTNLSGFGRESDVQGRRKPATPHPKAIHADAVEGLATRMRQSSSAPSRALGEKLEALRTGHALSENDAKALRALPHMADSVERAAVINRLASKYKIKVEGGAKPAERTSGPPEEPPPIGTKERPPSPKAVAAKKAAFLEKARSGDPAQLEHLAKSTDAKGLQRAAEHLASQEDLRSPGIQKTIDTINERLGQLVQDPEVRYGMLLVKKYSLESTQIHQDLGREGFAATHDSPHRFDGFNWREHMGKGEGNQAFGAGTYLSSADMVHKYYKAMSTRAAGEKSPTYHVSVDIKPGELLNWDKEGWQQHPEVIAKLKEAGVYNAEWTGREMYDELGEKLSGLGPNAYLDAITRDGEKGKVQRAASEFLQEHGILGHEYEAAAGANGAKAPNYVIYDDSKISTNFVHFDASGVKATDVSTPAQRQAAYDIIKKTLGPQVNVEWATLAQMKHAGEFTRTSQGKGMPFDDVIRLSIHALNPTGVAYHESLHGLFANLRQSGDHDIVRVLEQFAESPRVLEQLRELLKDKPEALKQLADHEERAAYAYQFWAEGQLKVNGPVHSLFERVANFIKNVLGIWTNDQRAVHLMEYFKSGEYAKEMGDQTKVRDSVMKPGTNRVHEFLKNAVEPFQQMGEHLATAGGARLRDSGVPALRELADKMKLGTTAEGADPGYVPAARAARSRMVNQLGADLRGFTEAHMREALEALQTNTKPASAEAQKVRDVVTKTLKGAYKYMRQAGVKVNDLGITGDTYFPRVWDASYISGHQAEFQAMLEKYVKSGQLKGSPVDMMRRMMVTDGAEFHVETDMPGMQHVKERVLSFISHDDAAPFMKKDLYGTMNSYLSQATRRAEWARRFGDDGSLMRRLLERAQKQGATSEQLAYAQNFVRAVDGTLGDKINPTARRLIGNMLVYQNIRLLPLAIFSSAVDPNGIWVRGGTVGDAWKAFTRGIKEMKHNFVGKDGPTDDATRIAKLMGVIDDSALLHTLGASYSQGMVGDTGRKINDTFFRLNLMEQFNSSMRVSASEAAMSFIVRHAEAPTKHSERFLRELGLTKDDVETTPEGRLKVLVDDGLSKAQAAKMAAAVNRWVDGAVLRPDAVDKPVWMSDPHYALVAHLKQFVYSFQQTLLTRVMHEMKHGNYTPALAMASYVPTMLAADLLKGLIQGAGSQPAWKQDWDAGDYLENAVERAGLFGVGQFGVDAVRNVRHGGSGIGALSGPTLQQFGDAAQLMGGKESFKSFAINSMPAHTLYQHAFDGHTAVADPTFAE